MFPQAVFPQAVFPQVVFPQVVFPQAEFQRSSSGWPRGHEASVVQVECAASSEEDTNHEKNWCAVEPDIEPLSGVAKGYEGSGKLEPQRHDPQRAWIPVGWRRRIRFAGHARVKLRACEIFRKRIKVCKPHKHRHSLKVVESVLASSLSRHFQS